MSIVGALSDAFQNIEGRLGSLFNPGGSSNTQNQNSNPGSSSYTPPNVSIPSITTGNAGGTGTTNGTASSPEGKISANSEYEQIPSYGGTVPNTGALTNQLENEAQTEFDAKYNALNANYTDLYNSDINNQRTYATAQENAINGLIQHYSNVANLGTTRNNQDLQIALQTLAAQRGYAVKQTAFDRMSSLRNLAGNLAGSGITGSGLGGELGYEAGQQRSTAASSAAFNYNTAVNAANLSNTRGNQDLQNTLQEQTLQQQENLAGVQSGEATNEGRQNESLQSNLESLQNQETSDIGNYVTNGLSDAWNTYDQGAKQFYAQYGLSY